MLKIFSLSLSLIFVISVNAKEKECRQVMDPKSISVEWTGYKFTEKEGVTGKFEKVKVESSLSGPDIQSVVRDIKFEINGLKFDAGNLARNINLKRHFFKKFADKAKITGHIKKMPKSNSGELGLVLVANSVRGNIPMKYTIKDGVFEATGTMEMSDFKLNDALVSISKACFDLHKGKDGVSKTWSTVDLKASAKFKKECS